MKRQKLVLEFRKDENQNFFEILTKLPDSLARKIFKYVARYHQIYGIAEVRRKFSCGVSKEARREEQMVRQSILLIRQSIPPRIRREMQAHFRSHAHQEGVQ